MAQSELSSSPESAWFLGDITSYFQSLSPGVVTIVGLAFLAAAVWLGYRALPHFRAMRAIRNAPLVTVASGEDGLVKVVGSAHPAQEPREGFSTPDHVWRHRFQMSSTAVHGGARTHFVGLMLLRDGSGECLVDPQHARVFHSKLASGSTQFFDSYKIDTGDPVFAIGVLGKAKQRPGHGDLPRCTLRPSKKGVLIYSGQSEARTLFRLQARFWPLAGAGFLLALVAVWGLRTHMLTYDTDADFFRSLVSQPWAPIWERRPELYAPDAD